MPHGGISNHDFVHVALGKVLKAKNTITRSQRPPMRTVRAMTCNRPRTARGTKEHSSNATARDPAKDNGLHRPAEQ
eukprot:14517317-Heterocapsa_arctica.AAC.1